MSYSGSRYRPSGRQVAAPDDSQSRPSSHHNAPSRTSQPSGAFPADEYLGYSSADDDDDYYNRSSSGRAPGGSISSSHRNPGHGRSRSYGGYDDYDADDSDRGYGRGPQSSRASVDPRDDRRGHGGPSSSSSHRDRGYGRDYGRDSQQPGPSSRHGGEDMRGGDSRASESRREIPFRYVSPFDVGFGGSRERGGGGGRSDPFGDDWGFPSRSSGHRRSSGRDDGWFSDGESDWSDGFW
ncbi:hypothetical protein N0V85_003616 [Neurospora sp. IMI 360204]|nr:hypothetical protein N0V85_003616 [Neurospora sp. IMI 360204]